MEKKILSKILIVFGLIIIFTSLLDLFVIAYPLNLGNANWVNSVGQQLSDRAIMPVFGIVIALIGLFALEVKYNMKWKNLSIKLLGIISGLLGVLFISTTLMYGLTMKKVESMAVDSIKNQAQSVITRADSVYLSNKDKVKESDYKKYIDNVHNVTLSKIQELKFSMVKVNIKTVLSLLLFSGLYFFIFLISVFPNGIVSKKPSGKKSLVDEKHI